jgi:hypothetical protein
MGLDHVGRLRCGLAHGRLGAQPGGCRNLDAQWGAPPIGPSRSPERRERARRSRRKSGNENWRRASGRASRHRAASRGQRSPPALPPFVEPGADRDDDAAECERDENPRRMSRQGTSGRTAFWVSGQRHQEPDRAQLRSEHLLLDASGADRLRPRGRGSPRRRQGDALEYSAAAAGLGSFGVSLWAICSASLIQIVGAEIVW